MPNSFLANCRISFDNVLSLRHGAVQGKILPEVYRDFNNQGYKFKNKREVLNDKETGKHHRKQKIKAMIPYSFQKLIKKSVATNSVIEKYKNEIIAEMNALGIE